MKQYCTVFDSNYLAKGIAMIRSLEKHSPDAVIHVLAMDNETGEAVSRLGRVAVYGLPHFEAITGIGSVRAGRTHKEYCWTLGAVFTDYLARDVVGHTYSITYVDADCFFFSNPEVVFDEIGDKSIGITPHRFAKKDEARLLGNGRFAVQLVSFRGEVGRKCLSKWASQVREWCFYRHEDGKFGDQKYLDTWPTDYPGEVCEIANPGVGLAPWNIANYRLCDCNLGGSIHVDGQIIKIVMYHFHEYIHGERLTNWPLRESDKELIYAPYSAAIEEASTLIDVQTVRL